jgi:hypothetical protein
MICETLTFCPEPGHKRSLKKAVTRDGATLEQFVAAALAQRISENFEVRRKSAPDPLPEPRSGGE